MLTSGPPPHQASLQLGHLRSSRRFSSAREAPALLPTQQAMFYTPQEPELWQALQPPNLKSTLALNLVENTALSTWAGGTALTTLGTISTGVWSGTSIAGAKIDDNITLTNITQITNRAISDTSGTLTVARGGTGQTSFGQGWLHSDGTISLRSTSPTVNYITATSTTATSHFRGGVQTNLSQHHRHKRHTPPLPEALNWQPAASQSTALGVGGASGRRASFPSTTPAPLAPPLLPHASKPASLASALPLHTAKLSV